MQKKPKQTEMPFSIKFGKEVKQIYACKLTIDNYVN